MIITAYILALQKHTDNSKAGLDKLKSADTHISVTEQALGRDLISGIATFIAYWRERLRRMNSDCFQRLECSIYC